MFWWAQLMMAYWDWDVKIEIELLVNKVLWYKSIILFLGCYWRNDLNIVCGRLISEFVFSAWMMALFDWCRQIWTEGPLLLPDSEMIQKSAAALKHSSVYYARPLAVLSALSYPGGPQRVQEGCADTYSFMSKVCVGFASQPGAVSKSVLLFCHFLEVWFNLWSSTLQYLNPKLHSWKDLWL